MAIHPRWKALHTVEEYLDLEEQSDRRHEFYRGEIFALAGGSYRHSSILGDLYAVLNTGLRGSHCTMHTSDLRLLVETHDLYTYPDAMIICNGPRFAPNRSDTVVNPSVLFEVLSPSARDYDRGDKFLFYRTIPTFQEYLLIEQDLVLVEHFRRTQSGWLLTEYREMTESISLQAVDLRIPLRRIYERVDLPGHER